MKNSPHGTHLGAPSVDATEAQDPRILSAVRDYMTALEAGLRPSRREFASRFPDIQEQVRECLDGLAFVHSAASQIHAETQPHLPDAPAPELATPLGDFRLIREIGRGGMGIVYESEQLSLGRRVAVKVLPFSAALDPRRLQRFRNEAHAAAQLHHTNIVPVYAVGSERSVHFYAMQLIEGESLSTIIRRLKCSADDYDPGPDSETLLEPDPATQPPAPGGDGPLPPMSDAASSLSDLHTRKPSSYFQYVARLGLQAARALEYAHTRGVIHRDIKPANLLIDVCGTLWITDFGLAQFYSDADLTCTGDLVGTLAYMSPEQASGKAVLLDQRTDIYSLGITLYELLTLRRAFDGKSREQLLHQVTQVDPTAPRSIDARIEPELEVILQKAISKDPLERYQTAGEFAEDLRRYLDDEHVLARRPTLRQKFQKWTRRHRSLVLTAMCTVLVLCAGLLATTILIAREKNRTEAAYALEQARSREAIEQRNRAERNLEQAREAVDYFASAAEQQMTGNPAFRGIRRDFLEHSLAYYQQFLEDRRAEPTITREILGAKEHITEILGQLSMTDETRRIYRLIQLLANPPVQRDLDLSDLQLRDCRELLGRSIGDVSRVLHSPHLTDSDHKRYQQDAQTNDFRLQQFLSPEQYDRLNQIDWQVRGPAAFDDAQVIQALDLTDVQRTQIRRITEASRRPPESPMEGRGGPGPGRGGLSEMEKVDGLQKIKAILTPTQEAAYTAMLGEAFSGQVQRDSMPMRGGRGGPTRAN